MFWMLKAPLENTQGCFVSTLAVYCTVSCSLRIFIATSVHLMYVCQSSPFFLHDTLLGLLVTESSVTTTPPKFI